MAKLSDRARDWWEGLAPRERTMMLALGVTFGVSILGFVGMTISSGLERIENRNQDMRDALQQLHRKRLARAKGEAAESKQVKIPAEANRVDLENYLGRITNDVGVSYPKFNRGGQERGDLVESTGRIELKDLSIVELKDFLQAIEANPVVVVRELEIKRDLREKDKVDVNELVVATFYEKSADSGDDEAGSESEDE